jgi:hypothetical protein
MSYYSTDYLLEVLFDFHVYLISDRVKIFLFAIAST